MTFEEAEEYIKSKYGAVTDDGDSRIVYYNIGAGKYMVLKFELIDNEYRLKHAERIGRSGSVKVYEWNEDGIIILYDNAYAGAVHEPTSGGIGAPISK